MTDWLPQFGPNYNVDSARLKRFRSVTKAGLKTLEYEMRLAYGDEVEKAVLASQLSALKRVTSVPKINCASGTLHTTGEAIHEAVKAQQLAALRACPAQERRQRTPEKWQAMYDAAMKEKREREIKITQAA